MMPGIPSNRFTNPVLAGVDIVSAAAVISWWFDVLVHPVGVISTAVAALWYGYCLYEALEKRFKK